MLSAAVKVKFPASSFAVVGGGKRGTQMVFFRRGRTDDFRINLIRKCIIFGICCFCICFCIFASIFPFIFLFSFKLLIFLYGHFLFDLVRWMKMSGCMK